MPITDDKADDLRWTDLQATIDQLIEHRRVTRANDQEFLRKIDRRLMRDQGRATFSADEAAYLSDIIQSDAAMDEREKLEKQPAKRRQQEMRTAEERTLISSSQTADHLGTTTKALTESRLGKNGPDYFTFGDKIVYSLVEIRQYKEQSKPRRGRN